MTRLETFITALHNMSDAFDNLTEEEKINLPNEVTEADDMAINACQTIGALHLHGDIHGKVQAMGTLGKIIKENLFKLEEDPTNEELHKTGRDLMLILKVLRASALGD